VPDDDPDPPPDVVGFGFVFDAPGVTGVTGVLGGVTPLTGPVGFVTAFPTVSTVLFTVSVSPPVTSLTDPTALLTGAGPPCTVGTVTVGSSGAALATPPRAAVIAAVSAAARRV
jgi:hypothetical protein